MKSQTKEQGRRLLRPFVTTLVNSRVHPIVVTLVAFPLSIIGAILFSLGKFLWAGIIVLLIGLCDTLDGEVARRGNMKSTLGAFLDSVVDRVTEGIILLGISIYYFKINHWGAIAAGFALYFSYIVSYIRARAEGIRIECSIGFFERPVRIAILVFSAVVLGRKYMPYGLVTIAFGSFLTSLKRIFYVLRESQR